MEIITALAGLIDGKVDLAHPDKILRVELIGEQAGVSVLRPDEIVSVRGSARGRGAGASGP